MFLFFCSSRSRLYTSAHYLYHLYYIHPPESSTPESVNRRLRQVVDDIRPVKQTAARRVGPAQRLAALNDVVVTGQTALCDAAEGAAACVSDIVSVNYWERRGSPRWEGIWYGLG